MIESAFAEFSSLGAEKNVELVSVACCLSGGGSKAAQKMLLDEFKALGVAYQVFVANDSLAALFTAFSNGTIYFRSSSFHSN